MSRYPFHNFLPSHLEGKCNRSAQCHCWVPQPKVQEESGSTARHAYIGSVLEWIISKPGDSSINMEHFHSTHSTCFPLPTPFHSISWHVCFISNLRQLQPGDLVPVRAIPAKTPVTRPIPKERFVQKHTMVGAAKEVSDTKKNHQHKLNLNPCHRW